MNRNLSVSPQKLSLAMARACMNGPQLAEAAHLAKDTISRIYRGNGSPVRVSSRTVGKLARALGVDVLQIIEE